MATKQNAWLTEAATGAVLFKKVFLKISQNSQENTCASLFLNKVAGLSPEHLLQNTSGGLLLNFP